MIMSPTLGWRLFSFPLIQKSEITSQFRIVTYQRWLRCHYWWDRVQTATHVRLEPGSRRMATFAKSRVRVALRQQEQPNRRKKACDKAQSDRWQHEEGQAILPFCLDWKQRRMVPVPAEAVKSWSPSHEVWEADAEDYDVCQVCESTSNTPHPFLPDRFPT